MEKRTIKMAASDNVATALCDIVKGDSVTVYDEDQVQVAVLPATADIPYGNKIALNDVPDGGAIVKYGEVVGRACRDITAGTLVHVHNVRSLHLDIPERIIEDIIREMHIE